MDIKKRDVKDAGIARETVYGVITETMESALGAVGYEVVGRATEGIIVRDIEADTYVVIKAIAKGIEFDAEDAMSEYDEKKAKAIEKAEKAKAKAEKDKAKRAKDKAEKEAEATA